MKSGRQAAKNPVGAGLPAKAACQTTSMLNVPASSRASPLPQELHQVVATWDNQRASSRVR
ncbi:hypothetical protein F6R97_01760 [Pseudomonas sp. JV414]|nr:hypothetical protein [Pseudomonas sp. JV414]